MDDLFINKQELSALYSLPHTQQLTYLVGVRPYMDSNTGLAGIKRKISLQSIAEQLYVAPHPGIKSITYSRAQIKRALIGLEQAGIIRSKSQDLQLILECILATKHTFVQNKADTNPSQQPDIYAHHNNPIPERVISNPFQKADPSTIPKADTPLYISNNYYIYLSEQFEKFWTIYPLKKSKQNAWLKFQALKPTEELLAHIFTALENQMIFYNQVKSQGQWMPEWKYPANWLAQHCWEDEINSNTRQETTHATHQKRSSPSHDPFWDSCKDGVESELTNNIIELNAHRKA